MRSNIRRSVRVLGILIAFVGLIWGLANLSVIFGHRGPDCPKCRTGVLLTLIASANLLAHLIRAEIDAYKRRKQGEQASRPPGSQPPVT